MPYVINLQRNQAAQKETAPRPKKPADEKIPHKEEIPKELLSTITWQAPEYTQYKKTSDWYWVVGILTMGLFAVALIFRNFLFAGFSLLAGFTIALYGARPARTVSFSLSSEGVRIENRLYPYESLRSFWIFYNPSSIKEISIESQKIIMPHIRIPIGEEDPIQIRSFLQQFLPEKRQEETLIDAAMRYFRF